MEGVLYSRLPFYGFLLRPACGIAFHGRVPLFVLGASSLPDSILSLPLAALIPPWSSSHCTRSSLIYLSVQKSSASERRT